MGWLKYFEWVSFHGLIYSNKIDNWINENIVTLGEICFEIFVGGFGPGKVLMSCQSYVVC